MNAKHLIAVLVTLAGPALALAQAAPSGSGVTRAQVKAELAAARADGSLPLSEASYLPYQFASAAPATREQVTTELYRARANGEICGNEADCGRTSERAASRQPAPAAARKVHVCQNEAECDAAPHRDFTVTRAQVVAELYRARAAGEIPETEADNDIGRAALRSHTK
ncbi:MAG: hypothetical protein JWQ01_607 [Massilia sp.]|nr:hypothetical protein [Massilia sp.]